MYSPGYHGQLCQGTKGLGDLRKSQHRKGRVQIQEEVMWSTTPAGSSFSLVCVSILAHRDTPHMSFELLLSKYCLNSQLCHHIMPVTLLVPGGKSEGLRWRGIINTYI